MGHAVVISVITIGLWLASSSQATDLDASTALEKATKLLKGWHDFRHLKLSNNSKKGTKEKEPPKPGESCTENITETLAILLFDRLEVSQTYYPYKDFKTRSHVAHHLHFYESNMKFPTTKTRTDFCRSRIPQDFHRYEIDNETGFSIPYVPFHFVCSNVTRNCTHCMKIKKSEPDLFQACHDHDLKRPDPVHKDAYTLHYAIKKWFRKARISPPKVLNHKDACSSTLEQNLAMVKLWALMAKKTGLDPTDVEEYEKEWRIVEELNPKTYPHNFTWANETFHRDLVRQWKGVKWCKPRGGKDNLGLVCWHEKCEKCKDQQKFTTQDPNVTEICNIQVNEEYDEEDLAVESKTIKPVSSPVIVGLVTLSINILINDVCSSVKLC